MDDKTKTLKVEWSRLRNVCDLSDCEFETTETVPPLEGIIGQERAVSAMNFGLGIKAHGYNVFVSGATGTGKTTYARTAASKIAKTEPAPSDWCYVYNFEDPDRPLAIELPAGTGLAFSQEVRDLFSDLKSSMMEAFQSRDYERRRAAVLDEAQEKSRVFVSLANVKAGEQGFTIVRSGMAFMAVPVVQGKALTQEEYESLPEEEKKSIEDKGKGVQTIIVDLLRKLRELDAEVKARLRVLDRETATNASSHYIWEVKKKYLNVPKVLRYLDAFQEDVLNNLEEFKGERPDGEQKNPPAIASEIPERYRVNVLVNNAEKSGAPVVIETNPTYYNLFGRIEYKVKMGVMVTDLTLIKPGAIHRANGGYLIVQAADVLKNPGAWDGLKRTLRNRECKIETLPQRFGAETAGTLHPEPIPLNVKVIIIGSAHSYQYLYMTDEDFKKLFKIRVDFDTEMERNQAHTQRYASFISAQCQLNGLKPVHVSGFAKIVEYSSRLAEDQTKMSTCFNDIAEILLESDAWASRDGAPHIYDKHVVQAIKQKVYRSNLIEQKIQDMIQNGRIMIDTTGFKVGQVNGLTILNLGDHVFGKPTRITARVYTGRQSVVNIERETEMSGRIHSKGFLTLLGYLGGMYAKNKPLCLSASITLEQVYEEIEGDSASSTELYALLSALSGVPVNQEIAVTGSVNQHGEVQPVGGVTHKIEGFYDVCRLKGLTGSQGVIIPKQNMTNLMLREDVVAAVRDEQFHVWAVSTIDEGIEILTGVPAGEPDEKGSFLADTIHWLVDQRLMEFAKTMKAFSREWPYVEGGK